jgi:hypothetical protein
MINAHELNRGDKIQLTELDHHGVGVFFIFQVERPMDDQGNVKVFVVVKRAIQCPPNDMEKYAAEGESIRLGQEYFNVNDGSLIEQKERR